jgi:hypothetical protein
MPCSIRDHYNNFKQNILTDDTKGADIYSEEALNSDRYKKIMVEYDQELEKLTEEIYEEKYLKSIFSEIS